MKSKKSLKPRFEIYPLCFFLWIGLSACPMQSKVKKKSETDEPAMEAEMLWSSGPERAPTRNKRKVVVYGEGSYGVEDPITLPNQLPEDVDIELPPVKGGAEAVRAKARLEINVDDRSSEEKSIEAIYLREDPTEGRKTHIRVRLKRMGNAVEGKQYFKGTLRLSIERYDGRRIEFSFRVRSKPRGLQTTWSLVDRGLDPRLEETSEEKPVFEIGKFRIENKSQDTIVSEFSALPNVLAGYRVEEISYQDRKCPESSSTQSQFNYHSVIEKAVIVPDSNRAAKNVISILEKGESPLHLVRLEPGEVKVFSIFAVDRKDDPETQMVSTLFPVVCQEICLVHKCERTPGRRDSQAVHSEENSEDLLGCYCEEKGWKKNPGVLSVGSRASERAIFVSSGQSFFTKYRYADDDGLDQVVFHRALLNAVHF